MIKKLFSLNSHNLQEEEIEEAEEIINNNKTNKHN